MVKSLRGITEAREKREVVSVTTPLLIRLLEYAREDAKTDVDLHMVAERAIARGGVLDMTDYDYLVKK